jgi:hypothetical protein
MFVANPVKGKHLFPAEDLQYFAAQFPNASS